MFFNRKKNRPKERISFIKNNIDLLEELREKGISDKNINRITNPFFRIQDKNTNKKSGFGMGLSITKKIIEAHKGELLINSELNNFTKFIIRLPINL